MGKKGFTIVEIIISISLVLIVGVLSVVSFNLIKKHHKSETLQSMSKTIVTATNLYLETNEDVKDNLYENKKGMIIPLTTLKNSGLVDFGDLELNEKEDYVIALLGSTNPNEDLCAETYIAKTWEIKENEKIYICEKDYEAFINQKVEEKVNVAKDAINALTDSKIASSKSELSNEINDLEKEIDDLEKEVNDLKSQINGLTKFDEEYIFVGSNPNNYVKFDVTSKTNNYVYWPNDSDQDLWRIYSVSNDGIRLIYNKKVVVDRNKVKGTCNSSYTNCCTYSNVEFENYRTYSYYTKGLSYTEFTNTFDKSANKYKDGTAKALLYNNITKKDYIDITKFYVSYSIYGENNLYLNLASGVDDKLGAININQIEKAFGADGNYLRTLIKDSGGEIIIGSGSYSFDSYVISANTSSWTGSGQISDKYNGSCQQYGGAEYVPFVKLKSNIKIKNYDNCSVTNLRGSKTCPYELQQS